MSDEFRLDKWQWANGGKPQKWSYRHGSKFPLAKRNHGISSKIIRKMGLKCDHWFFTFRTRREAEEALCRAMLKIKDD
jgi:hypothetical protein